jgi:hypothetical protein
LTGLTITDILRERFRNMQKENPRARLEVLEVVRCASPGFKQWIQTASNGVVARDRPTITIKKTRHLFVIQPRE